jgi:hypothetical protein
MVSVVGTLADDERARYARTRGTTVGYVLIIALSVAVGVVVYRASGRVPVVEHDPRMWAGTEHGAPPGPPTNFERLSVSRERLSWHDRAIGVLGLVVAVAIGAAALASALYLVGRVAAALLEHAAAPSA